MSPILNSVAANILISLLSFVGAATLLRKKLGSNQSVAIMVSFAAGVMLGAAFFDILPEAFEDLNISEVLMWTLIGIVVSFLLERFLLWYHHHHVDRHQIEPSAYLVLFGDTIHNFVDGVAISASFLVSPAIGLTTTIAIAAHELPQELADFSILLHAGMKKKKALLYNFITALTAVFGAVISYLFLSSFEILIPLALSFTAGMFIYIALADLIPDLHHSQGSYLNIAQSLPFILGILLMLFVGTITPNEQKEEMHGEDYMVEQINEPYLNDNSSGELQD
ncbi:MAG: ZIP family metal transporter [Candidatus Roizmanbacteria bacterium]|nr:ZIP family metal transporter [Candidatus Roizmanbacteria bacterium]